MDEWMNGNAKKFVELTLTTAFRQWAPSKLFVVKHGAPGYHRYVAVRYCASGTLLSAPFELWAPRPLLPLSDLRNFAAHHSSREATTESTRVSTHLALGSIDATRRLSICCDKTVD